MFSLDRYRSSHPGIVRREGREYYRITDQGRHALEEVKPRLRDLVEEVLGHVGREGTDAPG
ncbi:uncharacterized protein sS8_0049 [Methylocaldum marinum]|uniref:Uncharacterized protein n=1 Tax=Methylocaldum marinum TaxID=1432792 RepID=A0A286T762_9GAMM|nr:hypothetical protein [Methylocaldum marinum]BBA32019.1 uncharacterized protein sS8_0049 [Methylocaldum marinum]